MANPNGGILYTKSLSRKTVEDAYIPDQEKIDLRQKQANI